MLHESDGLTRPVRDADRLGIGNAELDGVEVRPDDGVALRSTVEPFEELLREVVHEPLGIFLEEVAVAAVDGHREGLDEREDRAIYRILAGGHDVALDRPGLRVLGHLLLAIRSVAKDTGRADEGLVVRVGVAVPEDACEGVTADVLALSVLEDIPVLVVGVIPHGRTGALVTRRGGALRIRTE